MSVRVERSFDVDATPEDIWEFIADPAHRARAISVVDRFDQHGETTVWHIALPIPFVRTTIRVRTRDVVREPPEYVKFEGRSTAFDVTGEHTISVEGQASRVRNVFVVDGRAPGVERFFERNFESEIRNLERALRRYLAEQ
ncbi:Carbon monoxide dehydrogenase subunit G, CoxG [Halanaeroarchaeum sp. HSR-CO]|uniref:SRPBCC family protein n=1 Tax=Halanaeroarchaeum sp. HSR-CO TaxID=2866382 RepID=UPI00217F1286|nr:SRPBCC family protein [Halanaeroarchaeum sp. HSR-CO]UWG47685.1 Carbon monoxide dehydrogenase subunit G, CoxG [Halanaeroarchaeum sp. HSR-CO]